MVSLDANFRLKRYGRPNESDEPPLGDGYAYIVGTVAYNEYAAEKGGVQKDVRVCRLLLATLTFMSDLRLQRAESRRPCECAQGKGLRRVGPGRV